MNSGQSPSVPPRVEPAGGTTLAQGAPRRRARRTIAVLGDYMNFFSGGYEAQLRNVFHERCRAADLDLLLVYGRALDERQPASAAHNAIFDRMTPEGVDGLVLVSATLAALSGTEGLARLVERHADLPVCSLGAALPGVPSVVVDNRVGMRALVEHMVKDHGYRHPAFIAGTPGSPEAAQRLDVFREVLRDHGLAVRESAIETGLFVSRSGHAAMERILARGEPVDAVIAANDAMAFGAIRALREHKRRVPQEVAVTGFDDLMMARFGNPALTTVAQPFAAMAERAIELLLAQMDGRAAPECTLLPTEFVVRRSCGCEWGSHQPSRARTMPPRAPKDRLAAREAEIVAALTSILNADGDNAALNARRLVLALSAELANPGESLVQVVEELLTEIAGDSLRCRGLQQAIGWLRAEFHAVSHEAIEGSFWKALELLATALATAQVELRIQVDENYLKLLGARDQAAVAFDIESLGRELSRSLPATGVRTAFLSRYADAEQRELVPFVCLVDEAAIELPQAHERYPATQLFPSEILGRDGRGTWLLFPLVVESVKLGIALFSYSPSTHVYHVLSDQIGVALRTVGLHQEVVQQSMLHERSVQERFATAKRLQALSVLAGGVAHDLNNALGPLVALPDTMLAELRTLGLPHGVPAELAADIASIKAAALRASHTIKDLLTLGQQGATRREALDLNRVVAGYTSEEALRQLRKTHPRVTIRVEPPEEPLVIRASPAHLARVVINLIQNAAEAIPFEGQIVVKTCAARVLEETTRYETISPGQYAVLSVSDTGMGIPEHELSRVFEPYFSKKPLGETSGSGLGLAIVHGVVKEHEGFIDVASRPGGGTTFQLYFPLVSEAVTTAVLHSTHDHRKARVLFVDDDPTQLRTGRRLLTGMGYDVQTLRSGQEALSVFIHAAAAAESPCDLLILDVRLGEDQDGVAICEEIRRIFPAQRAILTSGHSVAAATESRLPRGVVWLPKPYTADALGAAVGTALAEPSAMSNAQ